jgi:hypothetical protein
MPATTVPWPSQSVFGPPTKFCWKMTSLLQSIHSFVANQGQQSAFQPQEQYQPQVQYQPSPPNYQQQATGGSALQNFIGGGFGQAIVRGAGFGIGDDLINHLFGRQDSHFRLPADGAKPCHRRVAPCRLPRAIASRERLIIMWHRNRSGAARRLAATEVLASRPAPPGG